MSTNILVFQMLHYAQQKQTYNKLLSRAESIFPSSQIYNNFKDELKLAFDSQASLDDYEFALDTFESLKTLQTSPIAVEGELANITSDPRFSAFTEIATLIDMPYSETMFVPTVEMATKISEETPFQPELSIMSGVESEIDTEAVISGAPKTDKVVLNVTAFGLQNPEAIYTSDGYISQNKLTTQKIEDEKTKAFENAVETAHTIEEVNTAVDTLTALNEVSIGTAPGDQDFAPGVDGIYSTPGSVSNVPGASTIVDSTLTTTIAEESALAKVMIEEEKRKAGEILQDNPDALTSAPDVGVGASFGTDLGPCQ